MSQIRKILDIRELSVLGGRHPVMKVLDIGAHKARGMESPVAWVVYY